MQQIFDLLVSYFSENWPELVWIVFAASIPAYFAARRSKSKWKNREFLDRLNVSQTTISEGVLRIRTVLEMDVNDIFLNDLAAKNIVSMARKTTLENPVIPIPKDDCWYYLNSVLNEISERFAEGQIRRDMGLPVNRQQYLLTLTCERAGAVRTQKIRAMLIRKDLLLNLPAEEPKYESPNHSTRWETLNKLAECYRSSPHMFVELEICI